MMMAREQATANKRNGFGQVTNVYSVDFLYLGHDNSA